MRESPPTSYVLSTYLAPPGHLAITARRHDQAVALWRVDERSVALARYWELERITGRKHHELPLHEGGRMTELLEWLLASEGLSLADVSTTWGTPGLGEEPPVPVMDTAGLPLHSIAHLWSGLAVSWDAFSTSDVIALAMDTGPDFTMEGDPVGSTWYAGAYARAGQVTLVPVESPGLLWAACETTFGKEPGTLMALASACDATVTFDVGRLLQRSFFGGARLVDEVFQTVAPLVDAAQDQLSVATDASPGAFTPDERVASAVMKVIQEASTRIVSRNVDALLAQSGFEPTQTFLSLSGGCALNCPTNSLLMEDYGFRGLLVPPCANDSGQALGIGVMSFQARGDLCDRSLDLGLPYVGPDALDIEGALERRSHLISSVEPFDPEVFVRDLEVAPVAWVDGAAEVGPRALGHRSLLGDPRSLATKERLNHIKQRQWWRPVAPIVLEDDVAAWFVGGRPSPFMLETFPVDPAKRTLVPAITHIDGSARIQTLTRDDDPPLWTAIKAFHRATGVPVVCNTSLNDRGEPIALDANSALDFCHSKGISVAYLSGRRVRLKDGSPSVSRPTPRPMAALFDTQDPRPPAVFGSDVEPAVMYLLYFWPSLRRLVDQPRGARRLRSIVLAAVAQDPSFHERAEGFLQHWKGLLAGTINDGSAAVVGVVRAVEGGHR